MTKRTKEELESALVAACEKIDALRKQNSRLNRLQRDFNVAYRNQLQKWVQHEQKQQATIEVSRRGPKGNQEKAKNRVDALLVEYDALRTRGKSPGEAMERANKALDLYDFKPYSMNPPKQLKALLKGHRPDDWP